MSFQYIKPTEEQIETMQMFRDEFEKLSKLIELNDDIPNSKGKALAQTKIEEASFWLNKAITHNS